MSIYIISPLACDQVTCAVCGVGMHNITMYNFVNVIMFCSYYL